MHENNLYELRTRRQLTQKEFAEKADINAGVYSRYERGETDIPLSVAKKIAVTYGVSIDFIAMHSVSEKGIQADEDNQIISDMVMQPIWDNSTDEKATLLAMVSKIREEQERTIAISEDAIQKILKVYKEKYPDN